MRIDLEEHFSAHFCVFIGSFSRQVLFTNKGINEEEEALFKSKPKAHGSFNKHKTILVFVHLRGSSHLCLHRGASKFSRNVLNLSTALQQVHQT